MSDQQNLHPFPTSPGAWASGDAGEVDEAGVALSPANELSDGGADRHDHHDGPAAEAADRPHAERGAHQAPDDEHTRGLRVLIMGPQGSGKGTQAGRLAKQWGIPSISTGEIFRANVAEGTDLGKTAQGYLDQGALVPDEVTNSMLSERIGHDDVANGFILDGYPRTMAQAQELDKLLADNGWRLDGVIVLDANREELINRIAKRATEEGRSDDNEEAVERRLVVYDQETAPLFDEYAKRGLLARVDGIGEVAVVTDRILSALADQVG